MIAVEPRRAATRSRLLHIDQDGTPHLPLDLVGGREAWGTVNRARRIVNREEGLVPGAVFRRHGRERIVSVVTSGLVVFREEGRDFCCSRREWRAWVGR